MHFKRKRSKRQVRCTLCTEHRWKGNSAGRFKPKDEVEEPENWPETNGEPESEIDDVYPVALPKKKKKKPFQLLMRYIGKASTWYGEDGRWLRRGKYATLESAEQAKSAMEKQFYYRNWEWKVEDNTISEEPDGQAGDCKSS